MPVRMLITPGRVIISKPGFTASAALADSQKIFDSDWQVSGVIIARGLVEIPSGLTTFTIPFPEQHFIPTAEVFYVEDGWFQAVAGRTTVNSIILDVEWASVGSQLAPGAYRWVVYGISQ